MLTINSTQKICFFKSDWDTAGGTFPKLNTTETRVVPACNFSADSDFVQVASNQFQTKKTGRKITEPISRPETDPIKKKKIWW